MLPDQNSIRLTSLRSEVKFVEKKWSKIRKLKSDPLNVVFPREKNCLVSNHRIIFMRKSLCYSTHNKKAWFPGGSVNPPR